MQEINLYQPVSKGVRGALSARSTGTVFGIVAVTLVAIYAFAWYQVDHLQKAVQVVRNQQAAQAAMTAAQGVQLDALTDEELDVLVKQLEASLDSKSRAMSLLANEGNGGVAGFSTRLRAFGMRHVEGIWLDQLLMGANVESVSVSGTTLLPDNVPRYLRSLAQDPALKGGKIDEFVIEKPVDKEGKSLNNGRLSFRAGSHALAPPPAAEEKS